MSDVVKAIIFLILVVAGVPVFFCVGYIVSVCAARTSTSVCIAWSWRPASVPLTIRSRSSPRGRRLRR